MDMKALQCFVRVSEMGSLSRAAAEAGMTQPSFSRSIAALEHHFGGRLFHRTGRGVTLTDLGEAALPRAKLLLVHADQLTADVRDLRQSPSGTVALGLLPSLVPRLASRLFERMSAEFPGIRLRILEGFSDQIERWLMEGRIDIALLARYRTLRSGKEDILLRSELLLIGPPGRRAPVSDVPFRQIAAAPLVLPGAPNGLRLLLEETARKHKCALNVVVEADSIVAQKELVRRCGCYTVLTAEAVAEERAHGMLTTRRIAKPRLARFTTVSTTTQRPLSRAARMVVKALRELTAP